MDAEVSSSPPSPPSESGKLFVGGIPSSTTDADLRAHFARFGEVADVEAIRDPVTGIGRGFGFVLFADPAATAQALREARHVVLGRTVEVKRAIPRSERYHCNQALERQYPNQPVHQNEASSNNNIDTSNGRESRPKKIFIGGLPSNLTDDDYRKYFERFGTINDFVVMRDSVSYRPRGFGFVTFDSEEAVENVMQNSRHELKGKSVEVKIAVPLMDGSINNLNGGNGNLRMNGGRGSKPSRFQSGTYQTFCPIYRYFLGYNTSPILSLYTSGSLPFVRGHPIVSYGGMSYGVPYRNPMEHWTSQSSLPYVINNGSSNYNMVTGGYIGRRAPNNGNSSKGHIIEAVEAGSATATQVEVGTNSR